jgi:hypothetical protein
VSAHSARIGGWTLYFAVVAVIAAVLWEAGVIFALGAAVVTGGISLGLSWFVLEVAATDAEPSDTTTDPTETRGRR